MLYPLSTTASRCIWILWVVAFGAFAGLLSFEAYRASTSKTWPVTDGVVISFYETPNYRYSVHEGIHVSERVSCNEFFNGYSTIRNLAKYAVRYPLNAKVRVHYHPDDPGLAVLETEFDSSILKAIAALFLFSLVGVVGFWRGWRWRIGRRSVLS